MKENEDFISAKFYSKVCTIILGIYTYYHQLEEKRVQHIWWLLKIYKK